MCLDDAIKGLIDEALSGPPQDTARMAQLNVQNTEGNLNTWKLAKWEQVYTLGELNKAKYSNEFKDTSFTFTDKNTQVLTTITVPLKTVDPALASLGSPSNVKELYTQMCTAFGYHKNNLNASGSQSTGTDLLNEICMFSRRAGGTVCDQKVLYMLLHWYPRRHELPELDHSLGGTARVSLGLGGSLNSPQALYPSAAVTQRQATKSSNKQKMEGLCAKVGEVANSIERMVNAVGGNYGTIESITQTFPPGMVEHADKLSSIDKQLKKVRKRNKKERKRKQEQQQLILSSEVKAKRRRKCQRMIDAAVYKFANPQMYSLKEIEVQKEIFDKFSLYDSSDDEIDGM